MTDGATTPTTSGCSKRPSSKAAASEEARRTLRYVEPLNEARTMLADLFSILLFGIVLHRVLCRLGVGYAGNQTVVIPDCLNQ